MAIITISRGTMSGGKKLAEMLAEKTGYRCISREIIIKGAKDYSIEEDKLYNAIRKSPTIIQKFTYERECYLGYLQATLCEYAKDDNLIYHGHAGHFLLKGISHVIRARITASMPYRIKSARDRMDIIDKDAEKYIKQVDHERIKWTKFLYGKDWSATEIYDIALHLEGDDLEFPCEMLLHAIEQPRFQTTAASQKAMNDLLVASRVRSAICGLPYIHPGDLNINSDDGSVIIRGRVKSQDISSEIEKIANSIEGVTDIEVKLDMDFRKIPIE
jgi:cytidylate kinase